METTKTMLNALISQKQKCIRRRLSSAETKEIERVCKTIAIPKIEKFFGGKFDYRTQGLKKIHQKALTGKMQQSSNSSNSLFNEDVELYLMEIFRILFGGEYHLEYQSRIFEDEPELTLVLRFVGLPYSLSLFGWAYTAIEHFKLYGNMPKWNRCEGECNIMNVYYSIKTVKQQLLAQKRSSVFDSPAWLNKTKV